MSTIERCYEVMGATLLVRCAHEGCAEAIDRFLGPLATPVWTTPDWIVECDREVAPRQLFRGREETEPLDGVRVQLPGQERALPWTMAEPPLLPLAAPPLRGRFVGLHAAAIAVGADRGLLLLGDRGSGKTTAAIALPSSDPDCALLGDEWAFLLRRTNVIQPFPQAIGVKDPATGDKAWWRADRLLPRVETGARAATHAIFLEPGATETVEPLGQAEAFGLLQKHHLAAGTDHDEAIVTLARLARVVRCGVLAPIAYERRAAAAAALREFVDRPRAG